MNIDITLERILSLISKKPDGSYIHGAKAEFARAIGYGDGQIVSMWENGQSQSYKGKLHEIAAKYHVSVEWLKGETDEKTPTDNFLPSAEQLDREFIDLLLQLTDDEIKIAVAYIKGMIANRK